MCKCSLCNSSKIKRLYQAEQYETSGIFYASPIPKDQKKIQSIEIEFCNDCGFIWQSSDNSNHKNYEQVDRATRSQLPDYIPYILSSIKETVANSSDLIVEIGSNDGTFMEHLIENGYHNIIGIEPSNFLADYANERGLKTLKSFFNSDTAAHIIETHGKAKFVVCRHTLEHVPNYSELLDGIYACLEEDGVAIIEVPDTDALLYNTFVQEVWDEHVNYFDSSTLSYACEKAGLTVNICESRDYRETKNLFVFVQKTKDPEGKVEQLVATEEKLNVCKNLSSIWDEFGRELFQQVQDAGVKVYSIGASHPQANFLNYTNLSEFIGACIDDDKLKQGKFLPLQKDVPIVSSQEFIADGNPKLLLCTAPGYPTWTDALIKETADQDIKVIFPYQLLADKTKMV